MECLDRHWVDLALACWWVGITAGWSLYVFRVNKKYATLLHLIIFMVMVSKSFSAFYILTCFGSSKGSVAYWFSYISNLILFLINYVGSIAIYYFTSLGLGYSYMHERGFQEISVVFVFLPAYATGLLLFIYPPVGLPLSSLYFQLLYIMLLKNILTTRTHIERNQTTYSDQQLSVMSKFKTATFWYCQVCSLQYLVIAGEFIFGVGDKWIDDGLRLIENLVILWIVFVARARRQAGFSEDLLYAVELIVRYIPVLQARFRGGSENFDDRGVVVVYPDRKESIGYAKPLEV